MWWELAKNPRGVTAYYSSPPELRGVEVHSVRLHRDGPVLELIVEMPSFPDQPSEHWSEDADVAQARFRFMEPREVTLADWGTSNIGDLSIERSGDAIQFRFTSPTTQLAGIAGAFDVDNFLGYIKDPA